MAVNRESVLRGIRPPAVCGIPGVMAIRSPAVAGSFYPGSARELDRVVRSFTRDEPDRVAARGIVVPHAGYIYSGGVAGEVFSRVFLPSRHLLFCPNHTGMGAEAALMAEGAWRMPWGDVPIDEELAARLSAACPFLREDPAAHREEHSLEVQLPFLYRFRPAFTFVPVALGHLSLAECRSLGEAAAAVLRETPEPVLLIASSDMSHYLPDATARAKDRKAIDAMLALDPEALHRTVRTERISMCGVIPATVLLFAVRALGAASAHLVRYATSGDVSGDRDRVVGYAGLLFR